MNYMDDDNHRDNESRIDNATPVLMVFSIGALLGVLISLVLTRSDQVKAAFRQVRQRYRQVPAEELVGLQSASPEAALPSSPQPASPHGPAHGSSPKTGKPSLKDTAPLEALAGKRWSTTTRYIMGVFLFLALLLVLFIGRAAIPMVIAAALLALFVDPLIVFLSGRLRLKRSLAVGITYFLVVAVLLLVPLLLLPSLVGAINFVLHIDAHTAAQRLSQVVESVAGAVQANPGLAALLKPTLDSLIANLDSIVSTTQPAAPATTLSVVELTAQIGRVLGTLAKFLGPTVAALASLFLTLLISLQMTLSANEMKNWNADLIPPGYGPELSYLFTDVRRTWTGFLRGQMSLMLIIGVVIWLGGTLLGLPQALFLGIIAGVLELIPSVGPTLAAIPAVLFALLFWSTYLPINNLIFALIVIGFYVLVQLLENQFLVPRIMGDAVDLPPLVVLIGTIAGAGAFGIMGALLATPVIATGNLVFRYVYRKVMEDYFVPPPEEEKPGFMDRVRSVLSRLRRPASPAKKT